MNEIMVPFLDLVTPHAALEEELVTIFRKALHSAGFIGGPMVEEFERDFAAFCGVKYCVGVNSGTDALRFAFMAAGTGNGDIVITVPNTFIATTEAISQAGASLEFVDIDPRTYNMDPEKLREFLETQCYIDDNTGGTVCRKNGKRVTAVVPVHLYGQTADMDRIGELAEKYHLAVIEDACQAHGAEYFSQKENRWMRAGSIGRAAAFSFYPGKNLGACGEGGAVTTGDAEIAAKIRMLRDHGQSRKYYHDIEGYNGRLDAIQAGILQVKLRYLSQWNESRREAAMRYHGLLGSIAEVVEPYEPEWTKCVYHLYVIRNGTREELQKYLAERNIFTALHYPVPLHLQKSYEHLGIREGTYPVAEKTAREILSLPMYPGLKEVQQVRVAEEINAFLRTAQLKA
jgi:dTDP-4-amino-4,6-dideoxygalactose transaminase